MRTRTQLTLMVGCLGWHFMANITDDRTPDPYPAMANSFRDPVYSNTAGADVRRALPCDVGGGRTRSRPSCWPLASAPR